MPGALYADFSDARPSPAAIKSAGYSGVIRYGSKTPAKNLTAAERLSYINEGLDVLGVWETTGTDALQGSTAGAADALAAEELFSDCDYPADAAHPILYAIDFGATAAQDVPVESYFEAIQGSPRFHGWGPYGSLSVIAAVAAVVPGATGYWQTVAWSGGQVWSRANLYQRLTPTLSIPGFAGQYDENELLIPFTGPAPFPPGPAPTGDDMLQLAAYDPTTGGFWCTDANGDLYCPPSGGAQAPFVAGLNQHPEYNAGEIESAGKNPCVGLVTFKDKNGQIGLCYVTQPEAGGTLGTPYAFYRFARNGQPD